MWARIHRWLAIALVALLVVWSVTGLLFHLKPGWGRAYDMPSAERDGGLRPAELAPLAAIAAAAGGDIGRIELFDTAIGPMYRVSTERGEQLFDARSGQPRPPIDVAEARALALDAVARSRYRAAYGDVVDATADDRAVHVRFAGGPIVDVGRGDARLAQRGADTDRIDWLYRVHYLQWTGHRTIDRALAIAGLLLIWAVMIPGVVLFVQRTRWFKRRG